jgi:hypothetical protein
MELSSILDALADNPSTEQTKTASYVEQSHSRSLESALDAALSMDKTASYADNSVATPSEDLVKIAQKLADAEQLALVKEAEMYGAAVCDGFIARMGEHESNGVKVASFGGGDVDDILVKQAMELGYRETRNELEKIAQQAYYEGYAETEKLAAAALQQGYNDTTKIASAALQQGYAEGQQMIKVAAEDRANRGYQHAINILGSLA